jgi:hypothetical protein
MKDMYAVEEDCMAFTEEILETYLFDKIRKYSGIELNYSFCEKSKFTGDIIGKLNCVSFDGIKENFVIRFFNSAMISIFLFDEQFMFIDDALKKEVRGIDGCIVYEGYLRDKTHEQILDIIFELFKILYGAEKIEYEEQLVTKIGFYRKNNYIVRINKPNCEKQTIQFENILFLIN